MTTTTLIELTPDPTSFDDDSFFHKVLRVAGDIPFVIDLVALYYCMTDDDTPLWAKASIAGALVYFLNPIDLIPDMIAILGYTDDAAVVAGAVATVRAHLHPSHYEQARALFS